MVCVRHRVLVLALWVVQAANVAGLPDAEWEGFFRNPLKYACDNPSVLTKELGACEFLRTTDHIPEDAQTRLLEQEGVSSQALDAM